jgi:hypoxanthine phosphoribosyltransferase
MKNYNYSWNEMRVGVNFLDAKVRDSGEDYSLIIALERGGLVPGVMLSHSLGIPMRAVQWSLRDGNIQNEQMLISILNWVDSARKILIVDDICDSGETLKSILAFINQRYYWFKGIDTAVLINNSAQDFVPTYTTKIIDRTHDSRWVIFPWETKALHTA